MKDKKNYVLIAVIIILSILVVSLTGYIVYDKVIKKEDVKVTEKPNKKPENEIKPEDDRGTIPTKKEIEEAVPAELVDEEFNNTNPSLNDLKKDSKKFFEELLDNYSGFNGQNRIGIIINNDYTNYDTLLKLYAEKDTRNIFLEVKSYIASNNDYLKQIKLAKNYVNVMSKDLYEKAYRELWGEDKVVNYSFNKVIDEFGGLRKSGDTVFVFDGGTGFVGPDFAGDRMEVTDYKLDGDYLIADVKYLSVEFLKDSVKLYKDVEQKYLIKEDTKFDDDVVNYTEEEIENYFKQYDNERGTYRLKFKKSSEDKFYWIETNYIG